MAHERAFIVFYFLPSLPCPGSIKRALLLVYFPYLEKVGL
jgi:hypothetical protein